MALENIIDLPIEVVDQISFMVRIFQAIGGLIVAYIIFNIVNVILNRKKKKQLETIANDLSEIKEILKSKK